MKTRRKRMNIPGIVTAVTVLFVISLLLAQGHRQSGEETDTTSLSDTTPPATTVPETTASPLGAYGAVAAFAQENSLPMDAWPEELIELLEKNADTEAFVLNYPLKKDRTPAIDLGELKDSSSVPLLYQWDQRWGYTAYGDNMMGITGCGPTCLSMVCIYLLNDTDYDPRYIADFSMANGYCVPGNGSAWTLISEGGKALGLDVTEIPLDENRIIRNLEAGNPIICVMGPGDFTETGHYIVMTGCVDGKIKVNDPNSKLRSETLWDYDTICDQIRNLWVCR